MIDNHNIDKEESEKKRLFEEEVARFRVIYEERARKAEEEAKRVEDLNKERTEEALKLLSIPIICAVVIFTFLANLQDQSNSLSLLEPKPDISKIKEDLNKYALQLVESTNKNIFGFTIKEPSADNLDYLIIFQTSDPKLMADITADEDKNLEGYVKNLTLTAGWNEKFCTPELKLLMTKWDISYVDGVLRDSKTQTNQSISLCANPSNPSLKDNLNTIQSYIEQRQ